MEDVGMIYCHLVNFPAIWHILVCCTKKNLATLVERARRCIDGSGQQKPLQDFVDRRKWPTPSFGKQSPLHGATFFCLECRNNSENVKMM
jgi:hypothetical protein